MVKRRRNASRPRTVKRKRYMRKRRGRYRAGISQYRALGAYRINRSLVPYKLKRTFNYCEKITLNAPSAANASYFFSCNSLYDPNRTSALNHQPMGFDQYLGVLYDHYVVIAAKMTLTAMSQGGSSDATSNQVIAITTRDTNTNTSDITRSIEQGHCTYGFLGSQDGASSTLTLTHKVNPSRFLGRSKPLSDPDLKGTLGTSPTEECFFEINAASIDGDDPPAIDMLVTIQYTAVLIERTQLTQS